MKKKIILIISGHDPTGGAGITADIETANYFNFHSVSILTCSTVQNTQGVLEINRMPENYIYKSFLGIIKEFKIDVIKIGLLPNIKASKEVMRIINHKKVIGVPIIIDPIIKSGRNNKLTTNDNLQFLIKNIYPRADLITPNNYEYGIIERNIINFKNIIITDHEITSKLITLKLKEDSLKKEKKFTVCRINKNFHGTGCTFSTAIACNIAMQHKIEKSVKISLSYIQKTILSSKISGIKQSFLNRGLK
jgi:hydroxymethylpyrimidine/phosphomethylpyrimidine kinase